MGYEVGLKEVTVKNDLISRETVRYLPEAACGVDNVSKIVESQLYKGERVQKNGSNVYFHDPQRKRPSVLVTALGNRLNIEIIFIYQNEEKEEEEEEENETKARYRLRLMIKYDIQKETWLDKPIQIIIERLIHFAREANNRENQNIIINDVNFNEAVDALTITKRIGAKKCYAVLLDKKSNLN